MATRWGANEWHVRIGKATKSRLKWYPFPLKFRLLPPQISFYLSSLSGEDLSLPVDLADVATKAAGFVHILGPTDQAASPTIGPVAGMMA